MSRGGRGRRHLPVAVAAVVALVALAATGEDASAGHGVREEGVAPTSAEDAALASDAISDAGTATAGAMREQPPVVWKLPITTGLDPLPAQPAGVPFPAAEWPTGPLPAGVDRARVDRDVAEAFGGPGAQSVQSVVVIQGGRLVYEGYKPGGGPQTVRSSYSVAKSFTGAWIGLLAARGRLDPMAPAPVRQWAEPADPRRAITVDQLLRMSSGLSWNELYSFDESNSIVGMINSPVYSDFVADRRLAAAPGTRFTYSTGTSALLAGIASDLLGGGPDGERFVRSQLLEPIGITSAKLDTDPAGRVVGGFGFNMTTRDFARFGLLYLRGGVWDGHRILPREWVDYARSPNPIAPSYGAHWWIYDEGHGFQALGLYGQHILVVPRLDLVIAINSNVDGGVDEVLAHRLYRVFSEAAGFRPDPGDSQ